LFFYKLAAIYFWYIFLRAAFAQEFVFKEILKKATKY